MYRKRIEQEILTKVIICEPVELEEKISDWLYDIQCEREDLIKYEMNQSIIDGKRLFIVCTIIYTVQKIEIS